MGTISCCDTTILGPAKGRCYNDIPGCTYPTVMNINSYSDLVVNLASGHYLVHRDWDFD